MFYLTLPSNSSLKHFPSNTLSNYVTSLPQEIDLPGEWEVGVAEIQYPRTWNNIGEGDLPSFSFKTPDHALVHLKLEAGFYPSSEAICAYIERALRLKLPTSPSLSLRVNPINRKVSIKIAQGHFLTIGETLREILGFDKRRFTNGKFEADRVGDPTRGLYSLFIYCNIVQPRVVGDSLVPLLNIVPVEGGHGENVYRRYSKVHYHRVQCRNFSEIEIDLRDDSGKPIYFERGKVFVTLHFRRSRLTAL